MKRAICDGCCKEFSKEDKYMNASLCLACTDVSANIYLCRRCLLKLVKKLKKFTKGRKCGWRIIKV